MKKEFMIKFPKLDQLSNDTTHYSSGWIYRPTKIDWTKKTQLSIYFLPNKDGRKNYNIKGGFTK